MGLVGNGHLYSFLSSHTFFLRFGLQRPMFLHTYLIPDLLLEIFACFQLSFAKLHMMGMLNENFVEAVLLACIVVLSMWTTFLNPQAGQKARLWTWAQEYAQHDEIFWVAMHIDNKCFIAYLADIPGGGQKLRMQVWWAVQAIGHHTRSNPIHVPFTFYVPTTSPRPLYVWAVSLIRSWNGKMLAAWNRSRRVLRTIERWCRSL